MKLMTGIKNSWLTARKTGVSASASHSKTTISRAHDPHAFLAHAREGDVAIERAAGAHASATTIDLLAFLDELERGLQHADVRLDADQHDLRAVAAGQSSQALGRDARKIASSRRWHPREGARGSSGTVGPSPFGYCSVAATGTPMRCAARTSQSALAHDCPGGRR